MQICRSLGILLLVVSLLWCHHLIVIKLGSGLRGICIICPSLRWLVHCSASIYYFSLPCFCSPIVPAFPFIFYVFLPASGRFRYSATGVVQINMFLSIWHIYLHWMGKRSIAQRDGEPWPDFPLLFRHCLQPWQYLSKWTYFIHFLIQSLICFRTPPTSAPLNSASASRGFSAPPTQVNLEVILPDSPDSSNPLSAVESTLSDISRSDADNESIPTTEPKRTAEHRNLDVTPVTASHSVRSSLAPVRKTSSRAMSEPLDILSSRPGSVKEFKTVSAHSVQLPPINQKVH